MANRFPEIREGVYQLNEDTQNLILAFLKKESFRPFESDADLELFIGKAFLILKLFPDEIIEALLNFRRFGNREGIFLLRGLKIDEERIGPTPNIYNYHSGLKKGFETEMYLLGCSSLVGEVFAFSSQYGGQIIQNLFPVQEHADEQVGTGSKSFLDWHTEDAAFEVRADIICLLCLRSDLYAATTFASIRNMEIPDKYKKMLFEPKYRVEIDVVHKITTHKSELSVPILFGSYEDPFLRLDPLYMTAEEPVAKEALKYIISQIPISGRQVVLEQGDLLFIDNYRTVHGRTEFVPKFDGTDRWIQRASITFDLRRSLDLRTKHFRIVTPK